MQSWRTTKRPRGRRRVRYGSTSRQVRVLAHPLRMRLVGALRVKGSVIVITPRRTARHKHRRDQLPPASTRRGRARHRGSRPRHRGGNVGGRRRTTSPTGSRATSMTTPTPEPRSSGSRATRYALLVETADRWFATPARVVTRLAGRLRHGRHLHYKSRPPDWRSSRRRWWQVAGALPPRGPTPTAPPDPEACARCMGLPGRLPRCARASR